MDIFQKAFNRERKKLSQRDGRPIYMVAGKGAIEFPEHVIHFSSARKFYESGDLNNSLRTVNKAIELSMIDDWKQYAFKANILEELERYQEAIHAYEKAIEINSDDIKVYALYHQIGIDYQFLENHEKAIEFYSYAIELKKQHPNSPSNKDMEGIEKGILLGRRMMQMYLNRGNSYYRLGQYKEAEKDCFSSLEIDPEYSVPYLLLYNIYGASGQAEKAMEFLHKAVALGNTNAREALDDLYSGELDHLTEEERAAVGECMHVTFIQQDFSEGKRLSLNLINKGIKNALPYLCLATIYETEENWTQCEDYAKSGLKFDEENLPLLNLMGIAICNQGADRIPEGLEYFKKGALSGDEMSSQNYEFWKSTE